MKKKTPAIMFQGTTSNAGKSVLTAAFCRILFNDGYRVAPFKAQNISLNSYVTKDGEEMGRAQVVQAQACRIEPSVLMNPVLIKPTADMKSQIIVFGKPVENINVNEYTKLKGHLKDTIHSAYDQLSSEHEVIVLEGAGSPAEVNLKSNDLVNMHMAQYANAPVLLVGDIDRGGVYAHFLGTYMCFDEVEKDLLKAYIVNRFRGDAQQLGPAHDFLLDKTKKPVIGVVPYITNLGLPEEDSVSFKDDRFLNNSDRKDCIHIACIDLPHISNFTDLDALRLEPDVELRIVRTISEIGDPDVIIIPGSKNVQSDLNTINSCGIARHIKRLAGQNRFVVGICGGFQMLGKTIADPFGLENSSCITLAGLELLNLETVLEKNKQLVLTNGKHLLSKLTVKGYEIHHGQTTIGCGNNVMFVNEKETPVGACNKSGRIWGTYLHGIFDNDEFRRWFIDEVRIAKGLSPLKKVQVCYDIDPYIERLASTVRESVDINRIYSWMGL